MTFSSTRGQLRPARVKLDETGAAATRFQCFPTSQGPCAGDVRIDAQLEGERVSVALVAIPEGAAEPAAAGVVAAPEFELRVVRPDAGVGRWAKPTTSVLADKTWWHWDGGLYEVTPDEEPEFDCSWDGGAHPGYTLPNGAPSSMGCDGEPIDVVLWEDRTDDAVDFCGSVTFTRPLTEPVYPRAAYKVVGPFAFGNSTACCSRYFCLREPSTLRYRLHLRTGWRSSFSVGARTRNFGASLFKKLPVELDTRSVPAGALVRLPTFEVGDGYREGDQPPVGQTGGAAPRPP